MSGILQMGGQETQGRNPNMDALMEMGQQLAHQMQVNNPTFVDTLRRQFEVTEEGAGAGDGSGAGDGPATREGSGSAESSTSGESTGSGLGEGFVARPSSPAAAWGGSRPGQGARPSSQDGPRLNSQAGLRPGAETHIAPSGQRPGLGARLGPLSDPSVQVATQAGSCTGTGEGGIQESSNSSSVSTNNEPPGPHGDARR